MSKKKIVGIYKITSPTGKSYIGQSRNIERRFRSYKSLTCKPQILIYRSLVKHGVENHRFEIIELCDFSQLNIRERYWQEYYNTLSPNGLNCCLVSTISKPMVVSDEVRAKISKGNMGKEVSPETRKRMSESMYKRIKSGAYTHKSTPCSEEKREKQSIKCYCYDIQGTFVTGYKSIIEAGRVLGVNLADINQALKGKRGLIGGFQWRLYKSKKYPL